MTHARGNAGMTLVETIVGAIIALVIGTIIFTIYSMYNSETKQSTLLSKLQRQYENVSEQIAFDTRRASRVVADMSEWTDPFIALDSNTSKTILMYGMNGAQIAGFQIAAGKLQELKGTWVDFQAGGGIVEVDTLSSYFMLNPNRDQVQARLKLKTQDRDSTYYFGPFKDGYTCRNQK
jgi:type II secretory pathway pseudopilin PulG